MTQAFPAQRESFWKSRWLTLLLIAADAAGFTIAWQGAYYFRLFLDPYMGAINDVAPYLQVSPLIVFAGVLNCMAFGLYVHRRRLNSLNRPSTLLKAAYHWLLYIVVIGFFFKELDLGRAVIIFAGIFGLLYLFSSRTLLRKLKTNALARNRGTIRTAIVGNGALAIETKDFLNSHPEIGYTLSGLILKNGDEISPEIQQLLQQHDIPVLGRLSTIQEIISQHQLEEIYLAISNLTQEEQLNLVHNLEIPGISYHVVSNIFGVIAEETKVDEIGSNPVITLRDGHLPWHQDLMKRTLDLLCSALGILLWLILFHWWIALVIKFTSKGPIFFVQERIGQDGKPFKLFKYRTMHTEAPAYSIAPTNDTDPRITPFGRWLRKTSLDELPQLVNVLKGDMSMVGPRPEMPFIVEKYEPWQRRRLDVKPGLTGLWQVIGRKNLPLHLNMQYDLYYIKNQSFLMDIEILLKTIPAVLKGKGAF